MLEKAIEKLKSEMEQNKNNSYIQVVGEFLLQYLKNLNPGADKILAKDKTIMKSLYEMKKAAIKKSTGSCAVLTDQEGFQEVLKYFGIQAEATAIIYTPPEIEIKTPEVKIEAKTEAKVNFNVSLDDLLM